MAIILQKKPQPKLNRDSNADFWIDYTKDNPLNL